MPLPSLISLWVACAAILGVGVGGVYPVIPAQVGKSTPQQDRDVAISTYRFWRELGYALGGGISVTILTEESVETCVIVIGALLLVTMLVIAMFYGPEKARIVKGKVPEEQALAERGT